MSKKQDLDFGARTLQKFHTSYIVVVPKPLISALRLKPGIVFNFVLNSEGVITLQRNESTEEVKKTLTGGGEVL